MQRRNARSRTVWNLVLALAIAAIGCGTTWAQSTANIEDRLPGVIRDPGRPEVHSFGTGLAWGHYNGDTNPNNAQSLTYGWDRLGDWGWRVDLGRQQRFNDTGLMLGGALRKSLKGGLGLNFGVGAGTSDLTPKYVLSFGATKPLVGVALSAGVTFDQSKLDNSSTTLNLGVDKWLPGWILGASVRSVWGNPGSTYANGFRLGATWYKWRKLYIGAGYDRGGVAYLVVTANDALVDYMSTTWSLNASYWLDGQQGLNAGFSYSDADFYILRSINVSYFREW